MIKVRLISNCFRNFVDFLTLKFIYSKAAVPGAQVHGQVGRRTSFEVKVNDQEIFSKLKTHAFPDFKDVVNIVKDVSEGGKPSTVERTKSCCVIL